MTRLRQRVLHGLNLGDGWSQLARYYDSWRYCGLSFGDADQGDVHRLYVAARLARVGESIIAPERVQLLQGFFEFLLDRLEGWRVRHGA